MLDKLFKIFLALTLLFVIGCSDDEEGGGIVDPVDTTAPLAISTLETSSPTGNTVTLNWISTGDDENLGKARQYDIRYSTALITAANFDDALMPDSTPYPKVAGSSESFVIDGLTAQTKYYFALKVADEADNWSGISNIDSATTLVGGSWQMIDAAELPSNLINDILVNGSDAYYATDNGLAYYDGSEWTIYQNDTADALSLVNDYINSIAMDSGGDLWLATAGGLSHFDGTDFINYTTENSPLTTDVIKAVAIDNNDNIWIGTGSRGLYLFDNSNWTNYNTSNSNLHQNSIASLAVDANDHLWIGLNFGGCAFYDGSDFTPYTSANGFISNGVWELGLDNQGKVWAATDQGGAVFDGANWVFYTTTNSPLADDVIISLEVDPNGVVWFGTRYGLYKFTGSSWLEINSANSELPNDFINCITTTPTYLHYIGTQNGATIYIE